MTEAGQMIPVRMHETDRRIVVVAPMPGLEPPDISVTIDGDEVTIHGAERGAHQRDVDLLLAEWAIGPYHRQLTLPAPVDGALANATYGNGVLVLTLPKSGPERPPRTAEVRLDVVTATRGEHVGHVGRDVRPAPGGQEPGP